jgi:hypothetical protein
MIVKYIALVKTLPSNKLILIIGSIFVVYKYVSYDLYRMRIFCDYYMLFSVVL